MRYLNTLSETGLYAIYAPLILVSSTLLLLAIYRQSSRREGYRPFAAAEFMATRLLLMFAGAALFLPLILSLLDFPLLKTMIATFVTLNLALIAGFFYQLTFARAEKISKNSALEDEISRVWKIVKSDPDNAGAYFRLGELYEKSGRLDDAISCYGKSNMLDPRVATKYTIDQVIRKKSGR